MHEVAAPLPFFFRELVGSGRVLLSNQLGAYAVLENRSQLEALIYGSIERLPSELVEELYAKCFLTEPRERRLRASLLASGLASTIAQALTPPGLFTVVPTLRCDHDCRYCQVSRAPIGASNRDLSLDSIPRILEHIQAVASEKLKIEFQGGEPLLAFDYIRSFVEQAERTLSNESVSYVICSALGPLTDEIIEWAREKEIFFSVSLDGNAFTHRRNCPSRFFDSYDNTINKIKKLQTAISYDRVSCIATVTRDTLDRPIELVDEYFNLDLSSIFVRPISPFGFASLPKSKLAYSPEEYAVFFGKVLERVLELNSERVFIEEGTLLRLHRIYDPGFSGCVDMQSPSGFLLGTLVFNYDGRIFGSDEARML